ncbi:MAG: CobD/CbiB family protein [Oxalobacter formigenes]|nr:CobD/CbiB family protein [Oxalobacter formigenes]
MVFFPIFFALLLDYFRPARLRCAVRGMAQALADRIEAGFNAGQPQHGRTGWLLLMPGLVIPVWVVYGICLYVNVFLAFFFNILILYLCLGMKDCSQFFSSVQLALISGDESGAGRLLAEWRGEKPEVREAPEIARLAIEHVLLVSHRQVFGVFFWFMLPYIGPAGAVFYRMAAHLARAWAENPDSRSEVFGQFAARAFFWIDWIPVKLTAMCFAVAGNFEDAVYAWRNFAGRWPDRNTGVLLSAAGGALGICLGTPPEKAVRRPYAEAAVTEQGGMEMESMPGEAPSVRFFQHATGLIWRVLLLWLLLFLFFTIMAWL